MSRRFVVLPLLSLSMLGLVACNDPGVEPDELDDVEFEPLCGQDGPVELLALAADEEVLMAYRIGDTDEIHVRVMVDDESELYEPPQVRRGTVIDECGGVIAEVAPPVRFLERWGEVLVGCMDNDDLVWLTDYDDPSPSILARQGCGVRQVGERRVTFDFEPDATVGRIVTIDTEGSGLMVRELVDAGSILHATVQSGIDGEILVQSPDLAVHRIDPDTGLGELLLEQAAERKWSTQGDVISYQLPSADPDEPGPLLLRDRRTGAEQTVDPGFPVRSFGWFGEGLLLTFGDELHELQWFRLDPLRALALPAGTTLLRQQDDGLLWLDRSDPALGVYELLLWREGEAPQSVLACPSCRAAAYDRSETYSSVLVQTADPERREMWRLFEAGGPPRMIGNALGAGTVLDDGRVLAVHVGDDFEHGPLLLAHELGKDDVTLAPRVDRSSIYFTLGFATPDEVVYEEVHDDGTSTLFRARIAP